MSEVPDVFEKLRDDVAELLRSLPPDDLQRKVPATPGWTIRDIAAHLAGDAACMRNGDFPTGFFEAFGDAAAVATLNEWTAGHVAAREDDSLEQILSEWEEDAKRIAAMMRGDESWPQEVPPFADRVLLTDLAVHQQDILGALGNGQHRDSPPIRIATAGYIAMMGFRLDGAGVAPLGFDMGEKVRVAGTGEPAATVRASRFEFFRALAGRRSPEQIEVYESRGDPAP